MAVRNIPICAPYPGNPAAGEGEIMDGFENEKDSEVVETEENREELESKVGEGLSQLFDEDPDESTPEEEPESSDEPEESDDGEPEADDSDGAGEDKETDDEPEEEHPVEEEAAVSDDTPTLPAAHIRSLKAYGWTDDEIEASFNHDSDGFLKTAAKIHDTRSQEVAKWAALGRQQQQATQTDDPEPKPKEQPKKSSDVFSPIDTAALKEKYGEDEMIDEIVGHLNQRIEEIGKLVPDIEQSRKFIEQAEQEALGKAIDGFFGDESLKSYREVYGTDYRTLSDEQLDARSKVLELADAIIAGAAHQGRDLDVQEALELAHESVSSEFKTKAIRDEIKGSVKKRNRGLTLKPSKRSTSSSPDSGTPKTRSQLESKTKDKLQEVFGS